MQKSLKLTTIYLFYLGITSVYAEEVFQPPDIVVTATRTAQTTDSALASVTVINREEIEHSQALTLPELLHSVPGVDIVTNGGLGKVSSLFLRGTNSSHVLVLVDGIKIGSPTLGVASWHDLPLAEIERIEVVRGPRSSLYGSEAVGGVIQIFTRQGSSEPKANASVGFGTHQTYQVNGGFSGASGETSYSLHANYLQNKGFNTCQSNLNGGCFANEPDRDGYDNTTVTARISHRFSDKIKVEVYGLRTQGNNQYDSTFNNQTDFVQQVLGSTGDLIVNEIWTTHLNVGQYHEKLDNFGNTPATRFDTKRTTASWQNNLAISDTHLLTVGYDYQQDEVDSTTAYVVKLRDNQGLFAQSQIQWQPIDLLVGLRYDHNQQFGNYTTGNVAFGYAINSTLRAMAAYGTAFKAPTFNDLYFPNYGNAALKPEESQSVEIGLTGKHTQGNWAVNVYRTQIDKLIGGFPVTNIDKARITGLDGSINWHIAEWEIGTQASWLRPTDKTSGHLLPRRAEQTINLQLGHHIGQWRVETNIFAQSHRFEDAENKQRLAGYGLVNVRAEYTLNKQWSLRARVDNIFAKDYQTALFYNSPGRVIFASVHYQQ